MKRYFTLLFIFICFFGTAQTDERPYSQPKLVVGIVIDQMRYDYLTRFWDKYDDGGFKRLVNEGFNCKNNHYNYEPTYTGPGHASVYTGTTPKMHGIIANEWYDRASMKMIYCADDDRYLSVGTGSIPGGKSPKNLITTTVTDELRLATQMKGKVVGIALKDRGAILPAGHTGTAYWFHGKDEGIWVSSDYYMNELPAWVKKFNTSRTIDQYIKTWNTLYPIATYTESGNDNNAFETKIPGVDAPVFPYDLPKLWEENKKYELIPWTPYGNSLTMDFSLAAIEGEALGQDAITDFLAISFSSTDYVGHAYGVNAKETEDTYIRLDKDIERLLNTLDKKVGSGNYTVFLTADHGVVHVPSYLQSLNIPGGYVVVDTVRKQLANFLEIRFGESKLLENVSNNQVYIDHDIAKKMKLDILEIQKALVEEVLTYEGIKEVYSAESMKTQNYTRDISMHIQNGYNHKRSGDVILVKEPGHISSSRKTGTTHGSSYSYDTHVPLLFYGKGINKGSTTKRTAITDIAPTISALLGIAFPNGTTGNPISEVID
ncbi:alkaline phosphatase PafA [Leptobacterium sp. I13]|uniref:alkaline phosphatase PafA n=1 Tax=Leptobacterium meishanense TaxID=3128904 RepID=UPI0030EBC7A6